MGGEDKSWKAESKDEESLSVRMRGGRVGRTKEMCLYSGEGGRE